jgi:AcrR family transcriptional regulator
LLGDILILEFNWMIKSTQVSTPPAADVSTEQKILDAAKTVFLRRGTAAARMHEIAEAAGVNQALLHYYFRSKAQLADAVFTQAAAQLFPPVVEVLASDASIEDKVRQVVKIELTTLSQTPHLPAYIIGEIGQAPERAAQFLDTAQKLKSSGSLSRMRATLQAQIDQQVVAGSMRKISAQQFLTNLLALCIFPFATRPMLQAVLDLDDRGFDRFLEGRKKEIPDFFLRALRSR